jgi:signal recognition particle GTPase
VAPVKLIGVGEKAEDLIEFRPQQFAEEMFS